MCEGFRERVRPGGSCVVMTVTQAVHPIEVTALLSGHVTYSRRNTIDNSYYIDNNVSVYVVFTLQRYPMMDHKTIQKIAILS